MKKIETSILIHAPIEKVWATLTNFQEYGNWNPFIKSVKGDPAKGNQIEVFIQPDQSSQKGESQKGMIFKPQVLENNGKDHFRWKGKLGIKGIFDGEHYFQLKEKGEQTEFIHGENFSGLLVGLLWGKIGESTKQGFEAMNQALKHQAEAK